MRVSRSAITIGLAVVTMLGGAGVASARPAPPAYSSHDSGYRHDDHGRYGHHHGKYGHHDHGRYGRHHGWRHHDHRGWHHGRGWSGHHHGGWHRHDYR